MRPELVIIFSLGMCSTAIAQELHPALLEGVSRREQGDLDAAIRSFRRGLQTAPTDTHLRLELAVTHAWKGELDDALSTYQAVLNDDPTITPARLGVARTLFWRGDHVEAAAAYKAVLADEPDDRDALVGLADVHRARMRRRQARELYRRALALNAEDAEAQRGLNAITDLPRAELELSVGVAAGPAMDVMPRGRIRFVSHLTPELRLRAGFDQDVRTNDVGAARRGLGAVGLRMGVADLEVGYQLSTAEDRRTHRVPLRLALTFGDWSLLAMTRPGRRDDGRWEHLGSVGVRRQLGRVFLLGQVFRGDHRDRRETALALTVGWDNERFRWRADVSYTIAPQSFGAFGTEAGVRIGRRHQVSLRLDVLTLGWRTLVGARYGVAF